ncbi:MAG: metalloregulator ArsR/SmtB family transcription factor [Nitrospinota bacterium]
MASSQKESTVFHAIADKNRRRMMDLLVERERPVNEIAAHFKISKSAVSQHLKVLYKAGLVQRRVEGPFRFYQASPHALREVYDWTSRYEKFWIQRLQKLGDYLDSKN